MSLSELCRVGYKTLINHFAVSYITHDYYSAVFSEDCTGLRYIARTATWAALSVKPSKECNFMYM